MVKINDKPQVFQSDQFGTLSQIENWIKIQLEDRILFENAGVYEDRYDYERTFPSCEFELSVNNRWVQMELHVEGTQLERAYGLITVKDLNSKSDEDLEDILYEALFNVFSKHSYRICRLIEKRLDEEDKDHEEFEATKRSLNIWLNRVI